MKNLISFLALLVVMLSTVKAQDTSLTVISADAKYFYKVMPADSIRARLLRRVRYVDSSTVYITPYFFNSYLLNWKSQIDNNYAPLYRLDSLRNAVANIQLTPGPQGTQGAAGPQGIQGIAGSNGATGTQGIQGLTGPAGAKGDVGAQGLTGTTGPQGSQGSQGSAGAKGDIGNTGAIGPMGPQGIQGVAGPVGLTGAIGPQGIQGSTGNTGATGSTGIQGIQGATGPAGTPATPNTAGSGISITGNVIANTAPDQTVTITGATGTYPTFSIPIVFADSAATVSDSAVFYLTSNRLSTGTALYTTKPVVSPAVNNIGGNYTFGWTISSDFKKLVVRAKVATNTAVIALIGISVLGSTVAVTTGTVIQIIAKEK